MFYAGNGSWLAGFTKKAHRDAFVEEHPTWDAERAVSGEARCYPQFADAKYNPNKVYDVYGKECISGTEAIMTMLNRRFGVSVAR